ncbi:hypothetical protein [Yoonia litorea]|uniref:hypothetical protein n=1 Tax=Yoonia litorea TaxID=1123755 RepID=UPI000B7CE70B|nr:hypothetical protein [Yoonia litorea]
MGVLSFHADDQKPATFGDLDDVASDPRIGSTVSPPTVLALVLGFVVDGYSDAALAEQTLKRRFAANWRQPRMTRCRR